MSVSQKNHSFGSCFSCQCCVFTEHPVKVCTVRISAVSVQESRAAPYDGQYMQKITVQNRFVQSAASDSSDERVNLLLRAGHEHIVACQLHTHRVLFRPPVCHHKAFKSPFVAQDIREQVGILRGIGTVYLVV